MQEFNVKFDAFIEKGRKRVLEDREQFRGKLSEVNGMLAYDTMFILQNMICRDTFVIVVMMVSEKSVGTLHKD